MDDHDHTSPPISASTQAVPLIPNLPAADTESTASNLPKAVREATASTLPAPKKAQPKRSTSTSTTPVPSRESSPVRPLLKNAAPSRSTPGPGRSRKNSSQDVSPARSASSNANPPSAAATQRALSAASTPVLHPVASEPTIRAPVPQKASITPEVRETPRWPVSPRLRSPPPVNRPTILSPRKTDQDLPSINVQRSSQSVGQLEGKPGTLESEVEESLSISGMRTPARGVSGASSTLETVQEISQPNTPGLEFESILETVHKLSSGPTAHDENYTDDASTKTITASTANISNESGSESGSKGEGKMKALTPVPALTARATIPAVKSLAGAGRGKVAGEGSARNMTVETETVSSIPQVALGGAGGAGNNGSIRTKPSSETIRPKKEKKKTTRKAPSVTSGTGEPPHLSRSRFRHHHHHSTREGVGDVFSTVTAPPPAARSPERMDGQGPSTSANSSGVTSPTRSVSQASRRTSLNLQLVGTMLTRPRPASSKADIFEAKVASAVDEANSSDSEETFVYESNPPEVSDRPRRFHSRTPSATSMASQVDQRNGVRSIMDGHHSVAMKKSMKFANSYSSNGPEPVAGEDDGKGTVRSTAGTGRGTAHHHIVGNRWGRNNGNGHPSLFDTESPFPNATKSKPPIINSPRTSSRPVSPRVPNMRMAVNGKKTSPVSSGYDLDDAADDERTPLVSTVRSSRSARGRRQAGSMRQLEHQASRQHRSFLARFAGCMVLAAMIVLVCSGVIGFMFATTQPLTDVKILAIKNIIASEQDIIFDLKVQARNPNLVVVTIEATDLVVFAKSDYAGTDTEWWRHPSSDDTPVRRRDDDPLDPPLGDDPSTRINLEIGKVCEFYSPLTFDGSPFHAEPATSLGQLRIDHPGNDTIPAGSARWGRVVQHEFDLIVRGTFKYILPLGQKQKTISVEGRVRVKPNAADQDPEEVHIN